jgi:hypothetical protein
MMDRSAPIEWEPMLRRVALRQYHACVSLLRRELSIGPEAQTSQSYGEILRRQPIGAIIESAPRPGSSIPPSRFPLSGPAVGERLSDPPSQSPR